MSVFRIDIHKTIQAICLLLKAIRKDRLEYISILKLLYIADRESWAERGAPITGDVPVAMKNGPVLSAVYSLINLDREEDLPLWLRYLHREDYDLQMKADPGTDQLSRYEGRKLTEVAERNAGLTWRELVEVTHGFGEWKKNNPEEQGVKMLPIPLSDILDAVGRSEQVESIREDMEARASMMLALQR